MEIPDSFTPELRCPHCAEHVQAADHFCGHCGREIQVSTLSHERRDVFAVLSPTLLYYFITLVLLAVYQLTEIFPEGFDGLLIVTIIDVTIVIIFWLNAFDGMRKLFSLANVKIHIMLLTIIGALLGSVVVSVVAEWIQVSISDDVFYNTYLFEDTSRPFLLAILFICVQPAIFEEVAFRGFLFNNLQEVTSARSAVYITSFLFGVLHLAFMSLLWLIPIGLAFAFLRMRYHTLWYGIVGHFTYNLAITYMEFRGWF